MFDAKFARKTLRRYRKKGLDPIERGMVKSVAPAERNGGRILEIGGGIGAIQAELIAAGAEGGEVVELLSAYEPYAKEVARDKHIEGRTTFRVADLLEEPNAVAPADVVVLNRVVCCTPDGVRLTALAARLATRVVVLSYPRDRFVVRAVTKLINAGMRLLGRTFRVFLHPTSALFAVAREQGFQTAESGRTFVWEYTALRREVPLRG
jgi:magnesium-protoporphyrin O-methyltransferase